METSAEARRRDDLRRVARQVGAGSGRQVDARTVTPTTLTVGTEMSISDGLVRNDAENRRHRRHYSGPPHTDIDCFE